MSAKDTGFGADTCAGEHHGPLAICQKLSKMICLIHHPIIADRDAELSQEIFNIPVAGIESRKDPGRVPYDTRGESVTFLSIYRPIIPVPSVRLSDPVTSVNLLTTPLLSFLYLGYIPIEVNFQVIDRQGSAIEAAKFPCPITLLPNLAETQLMLPMPFILLDLISEPWAGDERVLRGSRSAVRQRLNEEYGARCGRC
jgi:hypothetical protein